MGPASFVLEPASSVQLRCSQSTENSARGLVAGTVTSAYLQVASLAPASSSTVSVTLNCPSAS